MDAALQPVDGRAGHFVLHHGDGAESVQIAVDGDRVFVRLRGETHEVRALDAVELARREGRAARGDAVALAPMPGAVVEVRVAVGDRVEAGTALLVIESMKLQTTIEAELTGVVAELPYAAGEPFEQGAVLARIEKSADAGEGEPGRRLVDGADDHIDGAWLGGLEWDAACSTSRSRRHSHDDRRSAGFRRLGDRQRDSGGVADFRNDWQAERAGDAAVVLCERRDGSGDAWAIHRPTGAQRTGRNGERKLPRRRAGHPVRAVDCAADPALPSIELGRSAGATTKHGAVPFVPDHWRADQAWHWAELHPRDVAQRGRRVGGRAGAGRVARVADWIGHGGARGWRRGGRQGVPGSFPAKQCATNRTIRRHLGAPWRGPSAKKPSGVRRTRGMVRGRCRGRLHVL